MENILSKEYAAFLEDALGKMTTLPVEGICIVAKLEGGSNFMSYYKSSPNDKLLFAGLLQQDAMIDVLKANNMLRDKNEDE